MILPEVETLLQQYNLYKEVGNQLSGLSRQLAIAKAAGLADNTLQGEYDRLSEELQGISDAMTYASPLVWIQYKNEAYKDEAQPIRTMHDFRLHCSKPGYICTKRFTFLDEYLRSLKKDSLHDKAVYPDALLLSQLLTSRDLQALVTDDSFMKQWNRYEFYTEGGRVAKWENWQ